MSRRFILIVVLILSAAVIARWAYQRHSLVPAKSWADRDQKIKSIEVKLQELANRVKSLQGTSECESSDECRVIGLGAPTCGRTRDFLVYSIRGINESELLNAVHAFNEKFKEMNELLLVVNKCGFEPARIRCEDRRCTPLNR